MQLELEACLEEINWMIRCHNCEALNNPQEDYPAKPLPIPPNYIDNLQSKLIKVKNGVLAQFSQWSSRPIISFQHVQHPKPQKQCSPMMRWGDIGTGRTSYRSVHEPRRERKRWLKMAPRARMRGEILFPKPRSRRTTNHHNSPIVISNWRYFGNKGQQQKQRLGERLPHSSRLRGKPEYSHNTTSRRP